MIVGTGAFGSLLKDLRVGQSDKACLTARKFNLVFPTLL